MSVPMTTIAIEVSLKERLARMAVQHHMDVDAFAADLLLEQVEVYETITDTDPAAP